ncbi:MAG TPA: DNA polymerase III subunit alpha, partial [Dehalococcoidia bacterium]|nr:DNA polymerase III subunit alpha [Dehalococcoidia bacterium]
DIDMDFQDDRREEVIRYCLDKYGEGHVAQIVTFGTLGAKAAVRDVGRALGTELSEVDRLARLIPNKLKITLEEAIYDTPELRQIANDGGPGQRLLELAQGIEGTVRHASTHAAGVMITEEPLTDFVPLARATNPDANAVPTTQYPMAPLDDLGLLKMDFLGLTNLTILDRALKLIAETCGETMTLPDIPLDDPATFKLLSSGETAGVFQLEGSGMRRYIKELRPNSVMDIAAMIALYRPGPMEFIGDFINAKHGRTAVTYPHDDLRNLLEETYGIVVYQDQVLLIAQRFGGYTLGEADILRKAMGKKDPEVMAAESEKFINGGIANGYSPELSQQMFDLIEPFAGYAFNKAHSVSYALIAYWTAYFKANYPAEYMVSLLNSYTGHTERVTSAIAECQRLNIPVLLPNVNRSNAEFTIEDQSDGPRAIRYGLAAVKNVGAAAIQPILDSRAEDGPYESLEQMCRSANMSGLKRNNLESLIRAGAFDEFGDRGALLTSIERILGLAQSEAGLKDSDQSSMFDLFGDSVPTPLANIVLPEVSTPSGELESWERDLLGVALSSANSLSSLLASAGGDTVKFRGDIGAEMAGKKISLVGQVSTVTHRFTKQNKPFAIASLSLMDGQVEVFVWEEQLDLTRDLWEEGRIVAVAGTVRLRGDDVSISCADAKEYAPDSESQATSLAHAPALANTAAGIASQTTSPEQPKSNGVQATEKNGTEAPTLARSASVAEAPVEPHLRLSLLIRESANAVDDSLLLDDIKRLLLEYSGPDEVSLEIVAGGQVYRLDWPMVRVQASDELTGRLGDLLGESGRAIVESPAN